MKTRISLFLVSLLAIAAIASATDLTGNQKRHVVNALPDNTLAEEVSDRLDGVDSIGETATVTVGAEASNAIDVTFQFLDEAGANLAIPIKVTCWQSELTTGLGLVTTAGTSAFTTQTYGTLLKSVTTGVLGDFVTDAEIGRAHV